VGNSQEAAQETAIELASLAAAQLPAFVPN